MRICFLADAQSAHTQRWVRAVQAKGHDVILISFRPAQIDNIPVYHIHTQKLIGISPTAPLISRYHYLFAKRRAQSIINTFKPDIVHSFYATSYGFLGARLKTEKYLISVWGQDITRSKKNLFMRLVVKYALSHARKIFCTSHFLIKETEELVDDKNRLAHLPFGINLEVFRPLAKKQESDTFVIGSLKPLEKYYGVKVLLEAFQQALRMNSQLRLVLIKSGKLLKYVKAFIQKGHYEKYISLVDPVEYKQVPELLNTFDTLVIPSFIESFGVAALEGSACKLPVIASRVGGLPEVVRHEKTGILVSPGDIHSLANALIMLSKNPALCQEYGANGRKFVSERYTWDSNVDTLLREYSMQNKIDLKNLINKGLV